MVTASPSSLQQISNLDAAKLHYAAVRISAHGYIE